MHDEIMRLFLTSMPELRVDQRIWQSLVPLCRAHRLVRGAVLFVQGQATPALFGVLQGEIEIRFTTIDGAVSSIEHVAAGHLFGLAAFSTGQPSTYEAVASKASRVLAIGPAAYDFLMDRVPGFARCLLREFARRHNEALRLLESSRHHTAIERLSLALQKCMRDGRTEEIDAEGWRFVRVTQAELAALANLSRQTVNALLAEMAGLGHLRASYGGLWLRG